MLEGVPDYRAYRTVAAVNACIFLGGVLHVCESYHSKTFKCAGRTEANKSTLVSLTYVSLTSVL